MTTRSDDPVEGKSSYTAALSYDPSRLRVRTTIRFCLLNLAPNSALLDRCLGYVSALTGVVLTIALSIGMACLVPSIVLSKLLGWTSYFNVGAKTGNISTSEAGSVTALKTLSARAQMSLQRCGGPDYLAPVFVDRLSLFGENIPGSRLLTKLYMSLARWNFYLTGRLFSDQLAECMPLDFRIGEQAMLQVRTCWLDDCVETFVREHMNTETGMADVNVVILGAGYDSRCYRLNLAERGVATFEVDAPGTQAAKLRVLEETDVDTGGTVFVTCDFESEDWFDRLKTSGLKSDRPTFFVWEGVTMYISRDTIKSTLEKVALCGMGSCIGCDYVDQTWALTPGMIRLTKRGGEPWKFGMKGAEPEELIYECNEALDAAAAEGGAELRHKLKVMDHLKYQELIKRYLAKHYDGRPIGYLGDYGGLLLVGSR